MNEIERHLTHIIRQILSLCFDEYQNIDKSCTPGFFVVDSDHVLYAPVAQYLANNNGHGKYKDTVFIAALGCIDPHMCDQHQAVKDYQEFLNNKKISSEYLMIPKGRAGSGCYLVVKCSTENMAVKVEETETKVSFQPPQKPAPKRDRPNRASFKYLFGNNN